MLIGMLRCKDEEKYLSNCLQSILPVCDRVYVMDDHSTDGTDKVIHNYTEKVYSFLSPFAPCDLDEARDKTWLLDQITRDIPIGEIGHKSPHWVLQVDADEELVESDQGKLRDTLQYPVPICYSVQILFLWDDEQTIRIDGMYSKCYRPSLFRLAKLGMTYQNHSGKLHTTGVPSFAGYDVRLHEPEPVRLLHYGYMGREERERKFQWYMERDSRQEEFYRRECFGPVITTPLSSILK